MTLRLYNTLTKQKEEFVPLEAGKVRMYVCGVTPYDLSHVGHARCYVAFDVVQRWLRTKYEVTYVRNFTDVEDKIIARGNEIGEDPIALAARFIDEYHADMDALGVAQADVEPKVSTHIEQIAAFVKKLEDEGYAYRVDSGSDVEGAGSDVYYRVKKFGTYTDLSGRNLDDMLSGARVDVDSRKESPLDFALWKSAKPGEPKWASPFGQGRPGWHIECSVMAAEHLGQTFDIHGGGKDLIFPHHTNEIAQSEACHGGAKFVRYWMHNGFVNVQDEDTCPVSQRPLGHIPVEDRISAEYNGQRYFFSSAQCLEKFKADPETYLKMSKSLGNFFTIRDVLARFTAESLRWLLLSTHYRNPIGFSPRLLEEAERRVAYVYETFQKVSEYLGQHEPDDGPGLKETFAHDSAPFDPYAQFCAGLDDDFSTPVAMAAFVEMLKVANLLVTGREKELIGKKLKPKDRARLLTEWQGEVGKMVAILGIGQKDPAAFLLAQRALRVKAMDIDESEVERLLAQRGTARANKDWAAADEARDALKAMGIEVRDTSAGQDWSVA